MKPVNSVVIFDDTCNLCNSSVRFIILHDPGNKFKFTGLHSDFSKDLKRRFHQDEFSSVALYEGEKLYFKSTAILRIFRRLENLWPLMYSFIIIPRSLRDFFYDFVSANREKWFGRSKECSICKTEDKERFIT